MLPRSLSYAFETLLALLSFAIGTALVRAYVPPAEGLGLRPKMDYFAAHKDEFEAVFIGSSRVYRGLDPLLVDEELARLGLETRSFNFAAGGMYTFEQDYILHHVLAQRPANLRWIFHEGGPFGMSLDSHNPFEAEANLRSARGIQWHTPGETLKVLASIRPLPIPLGEKVELAILHLNSLGRNVTNLGQGRAIVARLFETGHERKVREHLEGVVHVGRGYFGLEDLRGRPSSVEIEELQLDSTPYDERIARIPAENALPVSFDDFNPGAYREQFEAAAEAGVELVYFTPPGLEGSPELLRVHERGVVPTVLHLNDPERFPELFRIDHRFREGHLNRRGTELFSRLLAQAICAHVRGREEED